MINPQQRHESAEDRPQRLALMEFHTAVGIASRRDLMWDRSGKDGWGHFGDAMFINFSHVFLAKKKDAYTSCWTKMLGNPMQNMSYFHGIVQGGRQ